MTPKVARETVSLTIDGRQVSANPGQTVLEVCRNENIRIPTLCHDPRLEPYGGCRLCVVEVEGMRGYPTSCTTQITEGMVVTTQNDVLRSMRATTVELLLSDHNVSCLTCEANGRCTLQDLAYEFGIETRRYAGEKHEVFPVGDDPLIARDPSKCIACGRCVRICDEVQGVTVYAYRGSGFNMLPDTPYSMSLAEAGCEYCGQCVSTCPVGALTDRPTRFSGRPWETSVVESICGYCGVGCLVEYRVKDGRIVGASAPLGRGVNKGELCAKGRYGWSFTHHPDRLTAPLVRRDGELVETSWEEAIGLVAERFRSIAAEHGPDAIAGLASAKTTNEENYLFQKFMRTAVGTHNVDHCARLCHSSSVVGLAAAFGSGAMSNSVDDLGQAQVVLVIGSNTTEAHPVIGAELKRAARRGTRIFVIDPREIPLTSHAEAWLPIRPGTNTLLFNVMARIILDEGLADAEFIESRTEGFEEFAAFIVGIDIEACAEECGVPLADIRDAATAYASAERASIVYSMGVTQHVSGTEQVRALANLALLTGNIGRPGTGVNPLRGQNNVQGACDTACLPNCLPGYQPVTERHVLERFCDHWEIEKGLPDTPGLTLIEMWDAAVEGSLKAMYIMGENPVLADPDQSHVVEALESMDFLVVQDIFLSDTAAFAHVVLPAASYLEKTGTFTNTDRRVQLVHKVVDPPGEALPDGEILARLFAAMGLPIGDYDPSDVMDEIAAVTPQYGGISYRRLREEGALRWPCPTEDHPGTPILHVDGFTRGKGQFAVVEYRPSPDEPTPQRPFVLTTGRHLFNFHSDTMLRTPPGLGDLNPTGYVEMNEHDAADLGVREGDLVTLESRHGAVTAPVRICGAATPRRGTVFMPFHFADAPANRLTGGELDPMSKISGLKVTAVSIARQ